LSELLIGDFDLNDAIKNSGIDNLCLVTRGSVPPNPSELFMGQRFTQFMQDASKEFDLVIIDTQPVLAVTDASIIGHHEGTSLMLARF
jgi:tyrosine-protein kinase Etk/Wzc